MLKEIIVFAGGLVTGLAVASVLKTEFDPLDIPVVNSGCVLKDSPIKPEETDKVQLLKSPLCRAGA